METYTIEDVDTWLGCDEQVGRKVWQDSGLLKRSAEYALLRCRWQGWRLEFAKKNQGKSTQHEEEDEQEREKIYLWVAMDAVTKVFLSIKSGKKPKQPGAFPTIKKFEGYVGTTSSYRLCKSYCNKKTESLDAGKKKDDGDTVRPPIKVIPGGKSAEILTDLRRRYVKCRQLISVYMDDFNNFLLEKKKRRNLHGHYQTLLLWLDTRWDSMHPHPSSKELDNKKADLAVDAFIFLDQSRNDLITEFRDYCRTKSDDFNNNTFDSQNRRLRALFRQFGEGAGREQYREIKEVAQDD